MGGLRDKNGVEKENILNRIDFEFEGKYFKGPVGYDRYLTGLYGDYMQMPPESARINHNTKAKYKKQV